MPDIRDDFRRMISEARNALKDVPRIPEGFVEPTSYISRPAAAMMVLDLTSAELPDLSAGTAEQRQMTASRRRESGWPGGDFGHGAVIDQSQSRAFRPAAAPAGNPAGGSARVLPMIADHSLVAQAGAHILLRQERQGAHPTGPDGLVVLQAEAGHFSVVKPAHFSVVADGADADESESPVKRVKIDWENAEHHCFRVKLPRADEKKYGAVAADELLLSIVTGLAQTIDASLLASIVAANPDGFTLAKAAASGVRFAELDAIIGTTGHGASIRADGRLLAAGVPAELSDQTAATVVGAWSRAAVALDPRIDILAERLDGHGNLVLTARLNLVPLAPTATEHFWKVSP